jgi:hypothetical protein
MCETHSKIEQKPRLEPSHEESSLHVKGVRNSSCCVWVKKFSMVNLAVESIAHFQKVVPVITEKINMILCIFG